MKRLMMLIAVGVCTVQALAGVITGLVRDKATGEPVIGALITVRGHAGVGAASGLDGSFSIKNAPSGAVSVECRYLGYTAAVVDVRESSGALVIELAPAGALLGEATVEAERLTNTSMGARRMEMLSANVMNVMSAGAIRLSPDVDVAGVIRLMSGVVMENANAGEGRYAILRGMDKRYNYSLVNGVKIPSPDNKNRYVPLDLFPSELLDRLEVTKSLTPDMEGDASGGVVNMVMKDAPVSRVLHANFSLGYNSLFFDRSFASFGRGVDARSPRERSGATYAATPADFSSATTRISHSNPLPDFYAGITYGRRFASDRVGLMLSASYNNTHKGTNGLFYSDIMPQSESTVRLTEKKERTYSTHLMQYGAHAKADWRIAGGHKIEWYNSFVGMRSYQLRQTLATELTLNYDPASGNMIEEIQTRARRTTQGIFCSTLRGTHRLLPTLTAVWTGVYANATFRRPDNTYVNLENSVVNGASTITADNSERRWERNADNDRAVYADFTFTPPVDGAKIDVKAGGMYRHKKRNNHYVSYTFTPEAASRPVMGVDFHTIDEIAWKVNNPYGSVNSLNYRAEENIGAVYLMAKIESRLGHIIVGARGEHTEQGYDMVFPTTSDNPTGEQRYWDLLPSMHVKYALRTDMNLRASYYRSLNRPGFFEIVPYTIINEDYTEYGNKDLRRAHIDNVDLRWEWLPTPTEQLMVGLFYKHIKDPIEYAYYSKNSRQFGYGPANLGNADNVGIEIDFTKYIRKFGVRANYTYTYSRIVTPKALYSRDEGGRISLSFVDQKRTLVGQAPHVANLTLLYKDAALGWDCALTGSFISEKIAVASHYYNSDYYDNARFSLDFSAEKTFRSGLSVFFKGSNLLNSAYKQYIKTTNEANAEFEGQDLGSGKTLIRRDTQGCNLMLGLRYTL